MLELNMMNPFQLILKEKWITVSVIGSIFTFTFLDSFRKGILNPIIDVILPDRVFGHLNIKVDIKPGISTEEGDSIEFKFGDFIKQFILWIIIIAVLWLIACSVRWNPVVVGTPNEGSAIM